MQTRIRTTMVFIVLLCYAPEPKADELICEKATYRLIGSGEGASPPVPLIEIQEGPVEWADGESAQWWELQVIKDEDDGRSFRCQLLSDRIPMVAGGGTPERVHRYLLEEPGHPAVEWVDAETGDALLPRFRFLWNFVPRPLPDTASKERFAPAGMYLGHAITLVKVEWMPDDAWKPIVAERVVMNRNLLIGTSRTSKDDGTGRYPSWKKDVYPKGNYRYVELTDADYEELMAAGHNYFNWNEGFQAKFYDRPAFYRSRPSAARYPEEFYRSSYMGHRMYIDEPAVRSGGTLWKADIRHPEAGAAFLTTFVGTKINGAIDGVGEILKEQHVALGTIDLIDRDVPSWDTVLESSFYQFPTAVSGLIHENRAVLEDYNKALELYFGPGLEVSRDEMLYLQNAVMRGAARSFGKDWGTSIYGQMEDETRIPCAVKAYDMGARFIWFWTSDHDHHVPFPEQLAIARALSEHTAESPRPPVDELNRAATVAISIPYGYLLTLDNYLFPQGALWNVGHFSLANLNPDGVEYRKILAAAMWEGVACLRNGEEFDFVIDMEGFDPSGYERVVHVRADGTVENGRRVRRPRRITFSLGDTAPGEVVPATKTTRFTDVRPVIDGDLGEWEDATWVALDRIVGPTGELPRDPDDLSLRAAFAADAEYFYVAAEVHDDHQYQPCGEFPECQGDSLQIGLDAHCDRGERYRIDDVEFTITLTGEGPVAWRWVPGLTRRPGRIEGLDARIERTGDGRTLYEAAVPLEELKPLDPLVRERIGLNFAYGDLDPGEPETYTQWTGGLRDGWRMPVKFGAIDWVEPENTSSLPLRAQASVIRTAGLPGDAWEFDLWTAARRPEEAEVVVTLRPGTGGRSARHTVPLTLIGRQSFRVTVPTDAIEPGWYELGLEVRTGRKASYRREFSAYLLPTGY